VPARLLIDCDPGFDDAVALLLAAGHPDAEVVAITTVAGNQVLEKVTLNARRIATLAGLDVPVAQGCDRPLVRNQILAGEIHGDSGLDGPAYFEPTVELDRRHAVDLIIETVLASPGEITLVPIGPLTNIALAVRREPRIVQAAAGVTLMGGSYTRGNTTATAEFNILVDPEAAAVVFQAGWPVTMVGLDLTEQARITPDVRGRIEAIGNEASRFAIDLLTSFEQRMRERGWGSTAAMHDACAVAYAIDPTLMTGEDAYVAVELKGQHSYGMTVTDFRGREGEPNAFVPKVLDAERFWTMLVDSIGRVGRIGQPPS
jgi:purine nucleosidase